VKLEKSIVVGRSVESVFAFVSDMNNVRLWLPVREITPISGGPLRVGATYKQSAEMMGQIFEATIEITEYAPPHAFAFKTIDGPIPMKSHITCTKEDGGTHVVMVGEANLSGSVLKLAGPLFLPMLKKQLETQANKLKRILEARV
jgi:carbon monoxide dehydrogenase subunit G